MPPEDWSSEQIMDVESNESKGNAGLTAGAASMMGVFDDIVKGVSKHATQAAERLYDTPIGDVWASVQRDAENTARAVSEGMERMNGTYGYTTSDVWNLGDKQAEHIAKVMRRYAEETRAADAALAEETERRAVGIGSFANDLEMLYSIDSNVRRGGADTDVIIDERVAQREADFIADWDWFGARFVSPEYRYDIMPDSASNHADNGTLGDMLGEAVLAVAKSANSAASRVTDGVGWIDMKRLPEFEALRMASMLLTFADGNIGYPDGYRGSDRELLGDTRDDTWGKHQISLCLAFSDGVRKGDYGDTRARMELTNERIGEGFAAWEEDIHHAADVMESWGNWLSAYRHGGNGTMLDPDSPEVTALRAEFARCWHWIGQNASRLWW